LSGYVGLSTVLATLAAAAAVLLSGVLAIGTLAGLGFAAKAWLLATLLLIAAMHHGNIKRLIAGTEHRFENARLLRRWFAKQ
jgi:acyl phosphate:glycerol-3-phosphate acyltransferase